MLTRAEARLFMMLSIFFCRCSVNKFSMVQKQIFILHFVLSLFLAQRLEIAILTFLLDFGL